MLICTPPEEKPRGKITREALRSTGPGELGVGVGSLPTTRHQNVRGRLQFQGKARSGP